MMTCEHVMAEPTRIHGASTAPSCDMRRRLQECCVGRAKEKGSDKAAVGANQAPTDAMGWLLFSMQ